MFSFPHNDPELDTDILFEKLTWGQVNSLAKRFAWVDWE